MMHTRATTTGEPSPLLRPLVRTSLTGVPGQPYVLQRPFLMLAGIALVSKVAPAAAPLALLFVAIHALRGVRETAEACLLLFFLLLGNPHYTPEGTNFMRWVILFAGFARLQLDDLLNRTRGEGASAFTWGLVFFVGIEILVALLAGRYPLLSVLKLFSFFLGTYTMVTAFWRTRSLALYWRHWMYTLAAFVIVGSFFTFLAGDAYVRTERGMQGILTHPQVLGPVAATFTGWLFGGILTGKDQSFLSKLLVVGGLFLILLSGARTAGVALLVGLAAALLMLVLRRERVLDFSAVSPASILLLLTFGLGAGIMMAPQIQESIVSYVEKGDDVETFSELFEMSRGELISTSMQNFREAPVTGIGFGVPSDLAEVGRRAESWMDVPFSASSEKGFMPSAVLEETGVIGAILVTMLLLLVAVPVFRYGTIGVMWGFVAVLMTNIGAAVLFSVGGLGYFVWLFIAFCLAQTTVPESADAPAPWRPVPYYYGGYRPYGA